MMILILLFVVVIPCHGAKIGGREPTCRGNNLSELKEILKECKGVDLSEIIKALDSFRDEFRKEVDQKFQRLQIELDRSNNQSTQAMEELEKVKGEAIVQQQELNQKVQNLQTDLNKTRVQLVKAENNFERGLNTLVQTGVETLKHIEQEIKNVNSTIDIVKLDTKTLKDTTENSILKLSDRMNKGESRIHLATQAVPEVHAKVKEHDSKITKIEQLIQTESKTTHKEMTTLQNNWTDVKNTLGVIQASLAQVDKQTTALGERFGELKNGAWPKDSFCIFKNGPCPSGFEHISVTTIGQLFQGSGLADFGDSFVRKLYRNPYYSETRLSVCCK